MSPDQFTIQELTLAVGDGHKLYVQEWGNPAAQTTFVFLHGGPGSGCSDGHKDFFEPAKNRVIFFDQRGAGQSTPAGSLINNTTQDLVDDITTITNKLNVKSFVLVGGSWGSTLALAYALQQPDRIKALVLRGIFTGSQKEINFLDNGEFGAFFPDVWQKFVDSVPEDHKHNPSAYHGPRVVGDDTKAVQESALAYSELEGSIMGLDDRLSPIDPTTFDPNGTRIEVFYTQNLCFMEDEYILKNASKLTMPTWIVQGRYDAVCPPITAHRLHSQLPNSQLIMTTAGHSGSDRANFDAIKIIIGSFA